VIYVVGEYELDEERFELRRAGARVELQPKALQLLLFLVRNHERAVAKREILDAVWPDATVTDNSLARAVRLARVAIGDRDGHPTRIVTLSRRGYRFAAGARAVAVGAARGLEDAGRYVGRDQLLDRLGASLDVALRGSGRIVLLVGEAGIGKTRTAELLAERARRGGALVAAAWAPGEAVPTYASWARLVRALAAELPEAVSTLSRFVRADLASL
jgi:DNA-binding winged helix-turn-helix (wHTH) protein